MKYHLLAVVFAGATLVAPASAMAFCNGVGNSCGSFGSHYATYQPPQYMPQQSYSGYPEYSGYSSQSYQSSWSQPQSMYFPVYNTTFPNYGQQGGNQYMYPQQSGHPQYGYQGYSYASQGYGYQTGSYGYGTQYGQSSSGGYMVPAYQGCGYYCY